MIKFRDIEIDKGIKIKVTICKGVEQSGVVVFKDAAYCLKYTFGGVYRFNPLTNYAETCKFEII